jgi:hypothetical protein
MLAVDAVPVAQHPTGSSPQHGAAVAIAARLATADRPSCGGLTR